MGAILANLMFALAAITVSTHERTGAGIWLSEAVAALGLLLVIFGLVRSGRSTWVAAAVACYIAGAYWFTASTSFANPAVTIGRSLSVPSWPSSLSRRCGRTQLRARRPPRSTSSPRIAD